MTKKSFRIFIVCFSSRNFFPWAAKISWLNESILLVSHFVPSMPVLSFGPFVLTMLYLYLVKSLVILKMLLSTHWRKKKEDFRKCSIYMGPVFTHWYESFPVLCRYSRSNIKELGRLNQFMVISITHLTSLLIQGNANKIWYTTQP